MCVISIKRTRTTKVKCTSIIGVKIVQKRHHESRISCFFIVTSGFFSNLYLRAPRHYPYNQFLDENASTSCVHLISFLKPMH